MEQLNRMISHWSEPEILAQYNDYLLAIIVIYSFIEVFFPPIPGDTLLVLSGSLAVAAAVEPIWIVSAAFVGTFSASLLLYQLGQKMEGKLLSSSRFGWLLDSKMFLRIERGFARHGFLIILVSRFLPMARSGVILAAGMAGLGKKRSLLAMAFSILCSTSILVYGGRFLGNRLERIVMFWQDHFEIVLSIAAVTVISLWALIRLIKLSKKARCN